MPIKTHWLVPERLIRLQFEGDVSLEEIKVTADQVDALINNSAAPRVHVFHDAALLEKLPLGLKTIADLTGDAFKNPRLGWTLAYAVQQPILVFIGNTVTQLFRIRYRIVRDEQEAIAFLQEQDGSLPDLRPYIMNA